MKLLLHLTLVFLCLINVKSSDFDKKNVLSGPTKKRTDLLHEKVFKKSQLKEFQSHGFPKGGSEEVPEGNMSMASSIFNLAKNIIGGGMLALPAGMAAGQGTGWAAAVILVSLSGLFSAYTFFLIGKCTEYTKSPDFRTLWNRTLGPQTSWVIDAVFVTLMGGVSIMYSCFIGDLFSSLGKMTSLPDCLTNRTPAMLAITLVVLVPLCLLRDLSALSSSSLIGLVAVLYTAVFIGLRLFDGSYASGGQFLEGLDEAVKPSFKEGSTILSLGLGSTVLLNMLATAYMAHPNGVKFYNELKNRSFARFGVVVYGSMALAGALYLFVMLAGFQTFGMNSQGLILNNYHGSEDILATVGRLATGVSILTSYPFAFVALRSSFVSILKSARAPEKAQNQKSLLEKLGDKVATIDTSSKVWTTVTLLLMGLTTLVGAATKDVGLVVSLLGSLLGAGIIFSMPTAMYLSVLRSDKTISRSKSEVIALHLFVLLGGILAIMGTVVTLLDSFTDVFK